MGNISVITSTSSWPLTEIQSVWSVRGTYVTTSSSTCNSMLKISFPSMVCFGCTNSANLGRVEQSASNNTDRFPLECSCKSTEMSSNVFTVPDIKEHMSVSTLDVWIHGIRISQFDQNETYVWIPSRVTVAWLCRTWRRYWCSTKVEHLGMKSSVHSMFPSSSIYQWEYWPWLQWIL